MTPALQSGGKGHLVAAGFMNPVGVWFWINRLWVSGSNGDFIAGKREVSDGFIVGLRKK
jgi:hypothetical protein